MPKKQINKTKIVNSHQKQNNKISPRKTLIEQLYDKGWLDYVTSPYSSDARLRIGLKLMFNYQIIQKANLHSGYIVNTKIDSSISLESKIYCDAVNFYRNCLRAVPTEFWGIVRCVCLEEKMPIVSAQLSERQKTHLSYLYRIDLCRGLDRLISYTTKS